MSTAKGAPGAGEHFARIARLLDLAGRTEEARDAYLAACAESPSDSALASAFFLSLEMNDSEGMAEAQEQLSNGGGSRQLLLRALAQLRAGERSAARATLRGLADQTGDPDLALKALWVLYQSSLEQGAAAEQAAARAKLRSRFAPAPETALAGGPPSPASDARKPAVVSSPSPDILLGAQAAPVPSAAPVTTQVPAPPAPETAPPPAAQPQSTGKVSVQAGSFLMKENADDLLAELTKRGFTPSMIHEVVQGKDRYRVLAGTGLSSDDAKALLQRLSKEGFQGFPIAER